MADHHTRANPQPTWETTLEKYPALKVLSDRAKRARRDGHGESAHTWRGMTALLQAGVARSLAHCRSPRPYGLIPRSSKIVVLVDVGSKMLVHGRSGK